MKSSLFGGVSKKPRRTPKDLASKSHQCLERVINKCPLEKDQESLAKYFQENASDITRGRDARSRSENDTRVSGRMREAKYSVDDIARVTDVGI